MTPVSPADALRMAEGPWYLAPAPGKSLAATAVTLYAIVDRFLDGWTPDLSSTQPDAWERIEIDRDGCPFLVEPAQPMSPEESELLRALPHVRG